jgi:4-amino-4-deoxy-L-arabinose transferase-like glycosyltransferase
LVVCFVLFFLHLGDRELASSHEARAGQNAQAILNSGQWDLPRLFDGRVEMQKPPLYYWLVAALGWLNGGVVNAWCVRLPAALSALGCVLLLFFWGRRRGRPLAGFLAALMLATCLHFTALARTGRIDMVLTFTVALALVGFFEGARRWLLLAYVAVAAGVMLKGPIGLLLPAMVWVASRLSPRMAIRGLGLWWGLPLVVLLTLPWFLWANYQTDGEFFRVFFWHHNIDRGLGTEDKLRAYPFWYYGPQLLLDMLPWSLLLPLAMWRLRGDRDARFGAVWLLAIVVVLSCLRFKRADYLLPAFPGGAWMFACVCERWYLARPSRRLAVYFAATVAVTVAGWLGYLTVIVPAVEQTRSHREFAGEVRRRTAGNVLFFRAESHTVAFHVGQPLETLLEWENLDTWAGFPQHSYVVMPLDEYRQWPGELTRGSLEVVAVTEQRPARLPGWLEAVADFLDNRERPLVLVRTCRLPRLPENRYTMNR